MKKAYIQQILSLLLFGMNGIVASHINLSSYNIVLTRTLVGSVALIAMFFAFGNRFSFFKFKKDLLFIGISGVAMGVSWMLLYEAYSQIGVGIASLLYYCGPVIIMVLSPLLFGERLTVIKGVGFLAVLAGVILVNGGAGEKLNTRGIICGLLAAATYAVMVMANKKSRRVAGMENALIQLIFGFVTVFVFVGLKDGFALRIMPDDILWIAVLGIVNTGIGCYLYFASISALPVQSVAVLGYIEPLSAVLFSTLLLGEKMLPLQIAGAALIIGGAVFGECFCTTNTKEE